MNYITKRWDGDRMIDRQFVHIQIWGDIIVENGQTRIVNEKKNIQIITMASINREILAPYMDAPKRLSN